MPFGATIASNMFQRKLDQCFGHLQNVIVIADDIMVVGKKPNHKDHDVALTELLNTAKNVMSISITTNFNTNKKKLTSLGKPIQ